jgi:hypothetical protein
VELVLDLQRWIRARIRLLARVLLRERGVDRPIARVETELL